MTWLLLYLAAWFLTAILVGRSALRDMYDEVEAVAIGLALGLVWPLTLMGLVVWHFISSEERKR